ncbi:16176_t:CDS:2, partial [Funneliformis mosseae]
NTNHSVSLENISNFFWDLPNINIYSATVPDRMHHLDLGLFNYQIIYTRELLKQQHGNHLVDEIDQNTKNVENFITNKDLAKVYEQWNDMYKISRYETFKQSDLNKFE